MASARLRFPIDPAIAAAFDAIPNDLNELGFDPWGFSPEKAKEVYSFGKLIYRYFRPTIYDIDRVPAGRCLLVGNHSGQMPFDGLVVAVACVLEAKPPRVVRAMAERWFPTIPFINTFFSRAGVALGDPINCRNLLAHGNAILVFPEGVRGSGKPYSKRYQLADFGRGFMRLALQTQSPIVPFAVVGAEESIPSLFNFKALADLVGAPYVPVPMHLPLLGPLAYLPLPTRFHVYFGEPLHFEGPHDDEDEAIDQKVETVKGSIRQMLDRGLAERTSVF
jgi:1-acyl-sn-glycerol-3-phosphate acyltransferase